MFTVRCSPLLRKVKTTLYDLLRTLHWSFMKLFHPVLSGRSQNRYPKECIQSEILVPHLRFWYHILPGKLGFPLVDS